jgi:hypothetical protein
MDIQGTFKDLAIVETMEPGDPEVHASVLRVCAV